MKPPAVAETALVPVEPGTVEVLDGDPKWDRARKLLGEFKQVFVRSIDLQVMLGGELLALKTSLKFTARGGDRKSNRHDVGLNAPPRTWAEWCQAELMVADRTADRWIDCFRLIEGRARRLGDNSLARLLSTPASELSDVEYKVVSRVLRDLIGEQSQTELLREFSLLRRPSVTKGGDTSAAQKPFFLDPTPERAAAFLHAAGAAFAEAAKGVSRHRWAKEFEAWLALVSESELMRYCANIEKIVPEALADLEDIRARALRFVEARQEGHAATAKKARRKTTKP